MTTEEQAFKPKYHMALIQYHIRREMLVVGTGIKIKVFRDLHKRIKGSKPPLKAEEIEMLVKVTHEQCTDYMQQRVFRGNILDYYRGQLVLLNSYGRGSGGSLSGELEEAVARLSVGARED